MPRRELPQEFTELELVEKIEALEELVSVASELSEVLVNRAENTPFIASKTKTTFVSLSASGELKAGVELFIGGKRIPGIVFPKEVGGNETPSGFIVPANVAWEWKTAVGYEKATVLSTYLFIGGIGTRGPAGEKGERGETGKEGPKGEKGETGTKGEKGLQGIVSIKEIEETTFGKLKSKLLERGNELSEIGTVAAPWKNLFIKFIGSVETAEIKVIRGLASLIVEGILEFFGIVYLKESVAAAEEVNTNRATLTLTGAKAEIKRVTFKSIVALPGTHLVIHNGSAENQILVNSAEENGFELTTGANVELTPKQAIDLWFLSGKWRNSKI